MIKIHSDPKLTQETALVPTKEIVLYSPEIFGGPTTIFRSSKPPTPTHTTAKLLPLRLTTTGRDTHFNSCLHHPMVIPWYQQLSMQILLQNSK